MAHYVMGDIHGKADRFHAMLRPTMESKKPILDCRLIIGHTKVLNLFAPQMERLTHAIELEDAGDHLKILHTPGFINLDCECGYDMPIKALACLRLEDMIECYCQPMYFRKGR